MLSLLAVVGSILSIIFIDEFYDDDECVNDDGTSDDDGFCTKYRLQILQGVAGLFCIATAGLTWFFLQSGRYDKARENQGREASVHPVEEDQVKESDVEADPQTSTE